MPFCLVARPLCTWDRNKAGIILPTRGSLFVWINALQNVIKIYRETRTKCLTLIWFAATQAKDLICVTQRKALKKYLFPFLLQITLVPEPKISAAVIVNV